MTDQPITAPPPLWPGFDAADDNGVTALWSAVWDAATHSDLTLAGALQLAGRVAPDLQPKTVANLLDQARTRGWLSRHRATGGVFAYRRSWAVLWLTGEGR